MTQCQKQWRPGPLPQRTNCVSVHCHVYECTVGVCSVCALLWSDRTPPGSTLGPCRTQWILLLYNKQRSLATGESCFTKRPLKKSLTALGCVSPQLLAQTAGSSEQPWGGDPPAAAQGESSVSAQTSPLQRTEDWRETSPTWSWERVGRWGLRALLSVARRRGAFSLFELLYFLLFYYYYRWWSYFSWICKIYI